MCVFLLFLPGPETAGFYAYGRGGPSDRSRHLAEMERSTRWVIASARRDGAIAQVGGRVSRARWSDRPHGRSRQPGEMERSTRWVIATSGRDGAIDQVGDRVSWARWSDRPCGRSRRFAEASHEHPCSSADRMVHCWDRSMKRPLRLLAVALLGGMLTVGCEYVSGLNNIQQATGTGGKSSMATSGTGPMCGMPLPGQCSSANCPTCRDPQTCAFECATPSACPPGQITCPPGADCAVDCTVPNACNSRMIICPASGNHTCAVTCGQPTMANSVTSGTSMMLMPACGGTVVMCGDGPCSITCNGGNCVPSGAGQATMIHCGANSCDMICNASAPPEFTNTNSCGLSQCSMMAGG